MTEEHIQELVESVFSFDYIGDSMMAVRSNLEAEEPQRVMAEELFSAALTQTGGCSPEIEELVKQAAEARVQQYVTSSKKSKGTGCG